MHKMKRNDPCWCGSGKKYKRCHLDREKEKRLPFQAIREKANRGNDFRTCMHPRASRETCGIVISAHTLQRSRVLKAISEHNHVHSFYPLTNQKDGTIRLHKRGWRGASTFEAFCEKHDGIAFQALENSDFNGTKEQIFLIAYRAICWELYQKEKTIGSVDIMKDLLDRGTPQPVQQEIQVSSSVLSAGLKRGLEDLRRVKMQMDHSFETENYEPYSTLEVVMSGSLSVAATGAISPNFSISGTELQLLTDMQTDVQGLAFGTDVSTRGSSIVFLWQTDEEAPRMYVQEILNLSRDFLPQFLCQFFFMHCENTYFSPTWWNGLDRPVKDKLTGMMLNTNPYYSPPIYLDDLVAVPWRYDHHQLL